jgi:hypothetical protein
MQLRHCCGWGGAKSQEDHVLTVMSAFHPLRTLAGAVEQQSDPFPAAVRYSHITEPLNGLSVAERCVALPPWFEERSLWLAIFYT